MKYSDINYKYQASTVTEEEGIELTEQLNQAFINELGLDDLDLDEVKKESLESTYVGENPEGIY